MRKAILKRISRRKYNGTPVSYEKAEKLNAEIVRINNASGLHITFISDASRAFSSALKTYGMFSGVKSVFVMKGNSADPLLAEKIGYYGEELVLLATDLGLGTCWVGGTFDRDEITVPDGEEMICVITVGETAEQSGKEKIIRNRMSVKRKTGEERLTCYNKAPEWAREAMEAVRLAPSAVNSQKPMFHWQDGVVSADVEGYSPDAKGIARLYIVDLGIAKKHFEIEAGGVFALGQGAVFTRSEDRDAVQK